MRPAPVDDERGGCPEEKNRIVLDVRARDLEDRTFVFAVENREFEHHPGAGRRMGVDDDGVVAAVGNRWWGAHERLCTPDTFGPMGDTDMLAGKLLIAEPTLHAAAFHRTVTLMLEHNADGALGVVLDRPSDSPVADVLPEWADRVAPPGVVFSGGPVSPEVAICLGERADVGEAVGWQVAVGRLGTLDVSRAPEDLPGDIGRARIFSGYAGWSAGQLEGELEAGAWYVVDRIDDDCFSTDPDELWSRVLRRQPGKLAAVGLYPADPSWN